MVLTIVNYLITMVKTFLIIGTSFAISKNYTKKYKKEIILLLPFYIFNLIT
jgi:hypothetical protein